VSLFKKAQQSNTSKTTALMNKLTHLRLWDSAAAGKVSLNSNRDYN